MTTYTPLTLDNAPEASKPLIEKAIKSFGFLPNMIATLAYSPVALTGYLSIMGALEHADLTPQEKQVAFLVVSEFHGCDYCVPAHSKAARANGIDEETIKALQKGEPLSDPKLNVLRETTLALVKDRGHLGAEQKDAFFKAGFSKQALIDLVGIIAAKVISNFNHHIGQFELDDAFK